MSFKITLKKAFVAAAILVAGVSLAACSSSSSKKSASNSSYTSELQNPKQLTVGLEGTYPPFSYRKNGKLTGFEIDLATDVAKKLNLKVNFVPTKFDGLVAGLGSGKFDTILDNLSQTPARKKQYLFSTPYVYSKYVLITPSNSTIKSLKDIKGKKFADATGSDNEVIAKKYGANVVPSDQFTTTLDLLREGRAQGTINAESALLTYEQSHSIKGLKAKVLEKDEQAPAKVSALFNQKSPKLQKKFNQALQELRKDGTLKKLSVKYFGKDITTK